jgi:hypothetical protein
MYKLYCRCSSCESTVVVRPYEITETLKSLAWKLRGENWICSTCVDLEGGIEGRRAVAIEAMWSSTVTYHGKGVLRLWPDEMDAIGVKRHLEEVGVGGLIVQTATEEHLEVLHVNVLDGEGAGVEDVGELPG